MRKQIIFIGLMSALCQLGFAQINPQHLAKTWKLKSYDVIEKIKFLDAYRQGSAEMKKRFDQIAQLVLDSTQYDFKPNGTLVYTDVDQANVKIIRRKARWTVKEDILLIEETERAYKRKAKIKKLTTNQLILIPIINEKVGSSKMIFE